MDINNLFSERLSAYSMNEVAMHLNAIEPSEGTLSVFSKHHGNISEIVEAVNLYMQPEVMAVLLAFSLVFITSQSFLQKLK